jgi:hypothetical protein
VPFKLGLERTYHSQINLYRRSDPQRERIPSVVVFFDQTLVDEPCPDNTSDRDNHTHAE